MKYFLFLIFFSNFSFGESKTKRVYFNKKFGHLHLKPYSDASSETTIMCGYPLTLLDDSKNNYKDWKLVGLGDQKGYVALVDISKQRPDCFQKKYNVFYNQLDLSASDLYYWGKINDRILRFNTFETKK